MSMFSESAVKQRKGVKVGLIIAAACVIGFAGGRYSMLLQYPMMQDSAFRNLAFTYDEIMANYLNGADSKDLVDGAAVGMVASLEDPYSVYLVGDSGEKYVQSYSDHIVGIGVEIREQDGEFIIEETIKGAPSEKAGLKSGDAILEVDGKAAEGLSLADLKKLVQGEEGTTVKLAIRREQQAEQLEISVKRGAVPIHTVTYAMKDNLVGEIIISRFAEKTDEEFNEALDSLLKQGMKSLLLDLRSNPGGLLDPTIEIASRFVPEDEVIVQVVYKGDKRVITHKSEGKKPWTLPLAVLVDKHSASSSEVLTAALKASAHAEIIGERTFGKGIVQNFRQLSDGSVLKLTEAQWRSSDGQWIHKKGIDPTVLVEAPAYSQLPMLSAGLKLEQGDYGEKVDTVQQMLQTLAYLKLTERGVYDAATVEAVKAFQRAESLPATGITNDRTAYKLTVRLSEKYHAEDPQRNKALELLARSG
ncbi:Carboxy-terminal processing protease CtpA [Paenibacillus plantiphilus]|uniref:Carboxy-terminal processing protease CtpA n=1 Tax=Paenibacillus plantiphilus TaxID=2905650 RepID=A0ABM9BNG8_9BACL|nr:S41 family peptidase [Paenibacillus plantiphilus]CAH1190166.1 Carboxy-terminal processing protease CtpA [Paenibacillus plantiphilus]